MELEELEKAYDEDKINGVATAELFIGFLSTAGPTQSLSGIRELALYFTAKIDRRVLFEKRFGLEPLAGQEALPYNGPQQPRLQVMHEIQELIRAVVEKGWTVELFLNPQGCQVELISLFDAAGVDYLINNPDFNSRKLEPRQILQQICTSYDLKQEPTNNYPFGPFTDIGQQMASVARMVGCEFNYDRVACKVLKREPSVDAMENARDQAAVWYAFRDQADDHARALAAYDRPVTEVWANCENFGLHLFGSKVKLAEFFK